MRKNKSIIKSMLAVIMTLILTFGSTLSVLAASPTLIIRKNWSWQEGTFKINGAPQEGIYEMFSGETSPGNFNAPFGKTVIGTVYMQNTTSQQFDWSFISGPPVSRIWVKGGPNALEYDYGSGATSGFGLVAPDNKDISHVVFFFGQTPVDDDDDDPPAIIFVENS